MNRGWMVCGYLTLLVCVTFQFIAEASDVEHCCLEARARAFVAHESCLGDLTLDRLDMSECNYDGRGIWIRGYDLLHPEKAKTLSVFLSQRRGKISWVGIVADGSAATTNPGAGRALDAADAAWSFGRVLNLFDEHEFDSAEKAQWIVEESLHAAFAPDVITTGRPLGLAFFRSSTKLRCGSVVAHGNGGSEAANVGRVEYVEGHPIVVKKGNGEWQVILEEWRCEEKAIYRWTFFVPENGQYTRGARIEKIRAAPGCDCRAPGGIH